MLEDVEGIKFIQHFQIPSLEHANIFDLVKRFPNGFGLSSSHLPLKLVSINAPHQLVHKMP
jgi:hypothetical protein